MMILPRPARRASGNPFARLWNRLPFEAVPVAQRTCAQIHEAAMREGSEGMARRARALSLLCVDAFNANRPDTARAQRWRRFVANLAPFAGETASLPLRQFVLENAE